MITDRVKLLALLTGRNISCATCDHYRYKGNGLCRLFKSWNHVLPENKFSVGKLAIGNGMICVEWK